MSNEEKPLTEKTTNPSPINGAIPFITYNETTKKFVINKEAKKIISNSEKNKKIGIISLVGKYRTGKSFLLNRVIINNKENLKDGFAVAPTIKPCTKGIWLWSNPLIITNQNSNNEPFPVYLIDTEGLGAYDEEINHDSKIFLISILISSLFIYNSFGTIDETALSNLSFILNLSKSLKLKNNLQKDEEEDLINNNSINEESELAKYFPCLFWLLRDFVLKLVDSEGNPISSKQYLENSLMEQEGTSETILEKNLIRKKIKNYFIERDCFPMVRPVENEKDLQNLMNLPDDDIRPEFLTQSNHLREMIYTKVKPKNFGGKILSGEMLIELVESIINSINDGAIPVIENSWKYIANNECIKTIKTLIESYSKNIVNYQKNNLEKENFFEELQKYNEELTLEIINNFKNMNINKFDEEDIKEHLNSLKNNLKQEYKKLTNENINLLKDKYNYELNKEIENILSNKEKLSQINYITFIGELLQIKYKLDTSIPDFFLKQQISFDRIIEAIKKYIEEIFVKSKNSTDQTIHNLTTQNVLLEEKYKNISEEYTKDKNDFKETVNKYNDMLIENKLKLKTLDEKIKNFEIEKKMIKEANERAIAENNKKFEDKINSLNMEINKLKTDIKTKEEEILLERLNKEQMSALDKQKITFLENETEKWKERYNEQNKDLSVIKTEKNNLADDIDKLKAENKNLKNKVNSFGGTELNNVEKKMNATINSTSSGLYSGMNRASNKLLIELLSEQNSIKDFLNEIKNNTNKIIDMNKNILTNVQFLNKDNNNININNNLNNNEESKNIENDNEKDEFKIENNDNNNNEEFKIVENNGNEKEEFKIENNEKNMSNEFFNTIDNSNNSILNKDIDFNSNKENIINNNKEKNDEILMIKIINNILKNSDSEKPYLDYVCEIQFKEKTNKIDKKLSNFYEFHKSLREYFKDKINIPDKDNLFNEDNIENVSKENKQDLLNNYIERLLKINEIRQSQIFQNFFEIN